VELPPNVFQGDPPDLSPTKTSSPASRSGALSFAQVSETLSSEAGLSSGISPRIDPLTKFVVLSRDTLARLPGESASAKRKPSQRVKFPG